METNAAEKEARRSTGRGVRPGLVSGVLIGVAALIIFLVPSGATGAPRPGTPDRAFGKDGRLLRDFGTEPARVGEAEQVIPTAEGDLLVLSGDSISKLEPDGSVDRGFGSEGAIVQVQAVIRIALDPQGRILVLSSREYPAGVVTLERFGPEGHLDRSFGTRGVRQVAVPRARMGAISSMLVEPDGTSLLVGSGFGPADAKRQRIGAVRLRPDGELDRRYGEEGCASVQVPHGTSQEPHAVATLDGKDLVLAASAAEYVGQPNFFAVRFDAAGRIDRGFGTGGIVLDHLVDGVVGIAAGTDGRITAVDVGEGTGRLLPDGRPDPSFGVAGTVTEEHPRGSAVAMALEADGSTLIANLTDYRGLMLERRLPDGSLDPGFGGGQGYVELEFPTPGGTREEGAEVRARGLVVIPGRGTLVYGYAPAPDAPGEEHVIAAALFEATGSPIEEFGSDGRLLLRPLVRSTDFGSDLLAGRDGVTVTGRASGRVLLRRYLSDGAVDRGFRGGEPTLPASGAYLGDEGDVLARAPAGGILLGTGSGLGGGIYRFTPGGNPDPDFGGSGEVQIPGLDRVLDVAPARDGSIYAIGISLPNCRLELTRLRPDGALDRTFGDRGSEQIGYGSGACTFHHVAAVARRDGAVVVGGQLSGKILDEYSGAGRRLDLRKNNSPFLERSERLRTLVLDPRGRILLVGRIRHSLTVTRLTAAGRLDPGFGREGVARVAVGRFAEGSDLVLEADGKMVVTGFAELCRPHTSCHGSSPLIARLDPDGELDRGFASGGVWTGKAGEGAGLSAVALAPKAIYAVGWKNRIRSGRDLLLMRVHR